MTDGAERKPKPRSPWRIAWRHLLRNRMALAGGVILAILYFLALFAGFFAPYSLERQNRSNSFQPPTRIHFLDDEGRFYIRPFVYNYRLVDETRNIYEEDRSRRYPIRFFVKGDPYKLFGFIELSTHFFGVDSPGRIFILGSDLYGRDLFSRLLYGSQISLSIGLVGIFITFVFGMIIGGISGYFGGVTDVIMMRASEVLMSIPGLYLILALRAAFPLSLPSDQMYLIMVFILSFISWGGMSRVIRGMVLSIRENEYVLAAEALGYSTARIIVRHILPNTMSFVIVAATISVPGYILGEAALSFLGVGILEPQASWGNMLTQAQSVRVLTSYPWVLAPGFFIFITVLAYNFLGDGLRDALDPRKSR